MQPNQQANYEHTFRAVHDNEHVWFRLMLVPVKLLEAVSQKIAEPWLQESTSSGLG